MIALMKSGYIQKNGREDDPWLVRYVDNYDGVIGHFKSTKDNPNDFHTFEVDRQNDRFKEIEGTEKQIPNIPSDFKVTCKICHLQDYTGNKDLDPDFHKGFTIGKGKQLYFMFIWHGTGNVTVYPAQGGLSGRWIPGDTLITIHYK